MGKLLLVVMSVLLVMGLSLPVFAEDAPVAEPLGWNASFFNGTGVTAFWFPTDNTIAAGLNTNILRFKNNDPNNPTLSKISFDLDATIAKEFNEAKDTLYGLGVKVNYNQAMTSKTGVVFEPSIGLTALKSFKKTDDNKLEKAVDLVRDLKVAIYGNIILYKF